jgi:uncharacterized protein YraI
MGPGCPAMGDDCVRRPRWRTGAVGSRITLIAILLGLMIASVVMTPAGATADEAVVDAVDPLNVRAEPGTSSPILTAIDPSAAATILSGPTDDGWYQIQSGDVTGWVYGWYLAVDGVDQWTVPADTSSTTASAIDPAPSDTTTAAETSVSVGGPVGTAWVAAPEQSALAAPSVDAGAVDVFGSGAQVTIVGEPVDGYVPVAASSGEAWLPASSLSYDGPPGPEHWIDVSRTTHLVTLYQGDEPIASYWGAMGFDSSDAGFFATALGTYYVYDMHEALSWTTWGHSWVRDWVGFDPNRANGFHSYAMDASGNVLPGGDGLTGGCVALDPWAAAQLFSFVDYGTRVEVHW